MDIENFEEEMEELSSAEDFLEYFGIPYDQSVVHVNRLHILQRFHDYLAADVGLKELEVAERFERHKLLLAKAYLDFVESDAQTEKVFRVFHMNEPQEVFVSIDQLLGGGQ